MVKRASNRAVGGAVPGGFICKMGYLATALAGAMAVGAGTAMAMSWLDIRRYRHISSL